MGASSGPSESGREVKCQPSLGKGTSDGVGLARSRTIAMRRQPRGPQPQGRRGDVYLYLAACERRNAMTVESATAEITCSGLAGPVVGAAAKGNEGCKGVGCLTAVCCGG